MSSTLLYRLSFAIIIIAAFWIRIADLDRRPMHADEANQAVKTGELIESGHYAFDPRDHHGPTLYYAALPIAWLRGERNLATLTETTVRLVPAVAGTLSVFLLAALLGKSPVSCRAGPCGHAVSARRSGVATRASPTGPTPWFRFRWNAPSGRISEIPAVSTNPGGVKTPSRERNHWVALLAAAFLAVSPPAVYYSRYFIQETLLVTFTLGAFVCVRFWWRSGSLAWALGAGVALGLMQATKASAPLFVGAAIIAAIITQVPSPVAVRPRLHAALAVIAAFAVAALLYSSFGRNPAGIRDAFFVYGPALHRANEGAGHEKPWWYYLQLFGWQRNGGLVWQQLLFSALALIGTVAVFFQSNKFPRWVATYTLLVGATLSLTHYKTPWHALHFVPGMAILGAYAISAAPRTWLGTFVAVVTLATQFAQTRLVAFTRPADQRNPYAYVHSAPDVLKFRPLVETILASSPDGIVRVIGNEYWPLPWYLRGLPHVGYWSTPPDDCDAALVIATGEQSTAVREKLRGNYNESYLGLRPGVMAVIFTRRP